MRRAPTASRPRVGGQIRRADRTASLCTALASPLRDHGGVYTKKIVRTLGANGGEAMICFCANQPRQYQIRPHLDTGTIIRQLHVNRHCRNRPYEGPKVIMHRAPRLGIAHVGLLNRTKQFDPRRSMRTDTTDRIHGPTAPERLSGHMASVSCCKWRKQRPSRRRQCQALLECWEVPRIPARHLPHLHPRKEVRRAQQGAPELEQKLCA
jgi:hypothetical protein